MESSFMQPGRMTVYSVKLYGKHAVEARKLGQGNMSEGMRIAIENIAVIQKHKKEINAVVKQFLSKVNIPKAPDRCTSFCDCPSCNTVIETRLLINQATALLETLK